MRNVILLAAIGVSFLAFPSNPVSAAVNTAQGAGTATEWSAAKKQKAVQRHYRNSYTYRPERRSYGAIGCGYAGCGPVPRGCTVTAGFDWWGNYSGQDDVICGRR